MTMKIINNNYQYTPQKAFKFKSQMGLSLIELMISVVIGLFLLGGVITSFIGTKDSDKTRSAISEMDASARTALSVMRQYIQHAGYPSIHNKLLDKAFYSERDGTLSNPACGDGNTRDLVNSTPNSDEKTRDRSRGDVITIVTLADNPCLVGRASCENENDRNPEAQVYTDCAGGGAVRDTHVVACSADHVNNVGMPDSFQAKIYSTFHLGGGAASRTLFCSGSRGGTQPLADNIEAMQILYGLRQTNGNVIYRPADTVELNDDWGLVTSVQVAILVRSSSGKILKSDSAKTQYTLLNESRVIPTANRRHLYRVYSTTIHLANRNRGVLLR